MRAERKQTHNMQALVIVLGLHIVLPGFFGPMLVESVVLKKCLNNCRESKSRVRTGRKQKHKT